MNQFTEKYKEINDSDLLKIVYKPEDYQPLAVEAAKVELSNRKFTIEEINAAKSYYELQRTEKEILIAKQKGFENKIINIWYTLLETFNPVPKTEFTSQKLIRLIALVFTGISIFQFYKVIHNTKDVFRSETVDWINVGFTYIPLILVPTATFLFWKRMRIGWILFAVVLTYCITMIIEYVILAIHMQLSDYRGINGVMPKMDPILYAMPLVFYIATLWQICKWKIREIYKIDKNEIIITVGTTTAFVGLITFVIFFM